MLLSTLTTGCSTGSFAGMGGILASVHDPWEFGWLLLCTDVESKQILGYSSFLEYLEQCAAAKEAFC